MGYLRTCNELRSSLFVHHKYFFECQSRECYNFRRVFNKFFSQILKFDFSEPPFGLNMKKYKCKQAYSFGSVVIETSSTEFGESIKFIKYLNINFVMSYANLFLCTISIFLNVKVESAGILRRVLNEFFCNYNTSMRS